MRLLVCGGRDYCDREAVFRALDAFHAHRPVTVLIHGGAKGADTLSAEWALASGVVAKEYRADWKTHGRAAGPIRNQIMLNEGKPDHMLCFPGGRGTADMERRALLAGVSVTRAAPEKDGGK